MTEKLYDIDSGIFAFTACVTGCEPAGKGYALTLDRTAFFPEGGGQRGKALRDLRRAYPRVQPGQQPEGKAGTPQLVFPVGLAARLQREKDAFAHDAAHSG